MAKGVRDLRWVAWGYGGRLLGESVWGMVGEKKKKRIKGRPEGIRLCLCARTVSFFFISVGCSRVHEIVPEDALFFIAVPIKNSGSVVSCNFLIVEFWYFF